MQGQMYPPTTNWESICLLVLLILGLGLMVIRTYRSCSGRGLEKRIRAANNRRRESLSKQDNTH